MTRIIDLDKEQLMTSGFGGYYIIRKNECSEQPQFQPHDAHSISSHKTQ